MRTASVSELHERTSELMREVAEGEIIRIEQDGENVAELRALPKRPERKPLPDLTELWNRMPQISTDSGRILEEDR